MTGFASGFLVCGLGAAGYGMLVIRPEAVYRAGLAHLKAHELATSKLGVSGVITTEIRSQGLRAYKIDGGFHFGRGGIPIIPNWSPPRCQMIFDVNGDKYAGVVTVEATRPFGSAMLCNFVGLDIMNQQEERLLIYGDESRMYVKDQMRSFLSFKTENTKP